uniref:RRM domain-containing protein n=1 Tax=Alexandrium monilatum TaxID=311494 RepID=A0A7S4R432_9DINO
MGEAPPSDRVYITGLQKDMTDASLKEILGAYGTIKEAKVLPSGGAAIVTFATLDEAKWVVDNLDGNMPEGIKEAINVKFANSRGGSGGGGGGWGKSEGGSWGGNSWGGDKSGPYGGGKGWGKSGCMMGKGGFSIQMMKTSLLNMGVLPGGKWSKERTDEQQLYIKGLPPDTTDADLQEIFGPFGAIPPRGVKATLNPEGQCTGVGWVDFVEEADAAKAASVLNGMTMADGSWLRVCVKAHMKGGSKGGKDKK